MAHEIWYRLKSSSAQEPRSTREPGCGAGEMESEMAKLIPLKDIPYRARRIEALARRDLGADALESAHYQIKGAPGCYGGAFAPVYGWCVTEEAAAALAGLVTHMPGGTTHHRISYSVV